MTTLDRIYIETKSGRAKHTYHVVITSHAYMDDGRTMPAFENQTPAAFNSRGDAEVFIIELERRLITNLGHKVERR